MFGLVWFKGKISRYSSGCHWTFVTSLDYLRLLSITGTTPGLGSKSQFPGSMDFFLRQVLAQADLDFEILLPHRLKC